MKLKIMSMIAVMALLISCGTSRTSTTAYPAYDVPDNIRTSFVTLYPTATNVEWSRYDATAVPIDWELTDWRVLDVNDYVAQFNVGDDRFYAWYDADGAWVGSAYAVNDHTLLPSAVHSLLTTNYAGYNIEKVQKEYWKDRTAYEIKLKRNDDDKVKLLVDANGTIIKQKLKD